MYDIEIDVSAMEIFVNDPSTSKEINFGNL